MPKRAPLLQAQRLAGLTPQDITYVEAHGTGTRLGDPVEFSALSQAFAGASQKAVLCAGVGKNQYRPFGYGSGRRRVDKNRAGSAAGNNSRNIAL